MFLHCKNIIIKVAGAHEYHYNSDFLLTVFLYFPAGQKLQTRTTHSFYSKLTVYDPFLVANVKSSVF